MHHRLSTDLLEILLDINRVVVNVGKVARCRQQHKRESQQQCVSVWLYR